MLIKTQHPVYDFDHLYLGGGGRNDSGGRHTVRAVYQFQ